MKPTLYYYEHCPFCIRVLALAGLADISLNKKILLNDDEKTPIAMTGIKALPILEIEQGKFMPESLDIVDYLSEKFNFSLDKNPNDIKLVDNFLQENRLLIYKLAMPRWAKIPFEEFATDSAIAYFTKKKTQTVGNFSQAIAETEQLSNELFATLENNNSLFDDLLEKPQSLAAIMLFSALVGITCVKGFNLPNSANTFMQTMSQHTKVALLTDRAI